MNFTLFSNPIYSIFRRLVIAFFTPVVFSLRTGHFKSSLKKKAVDRSGDALPWLSYPVIEFLRHRELKGKTVLEFGAGQSTVWWEKQGAIVTALETNEDWKSYVEKVLPSCEVYSADHKFTNIPESVRSRRFDIILVDGGNRKTAMEEAIKLVSETGVILLDDSAVTSSRHYIASPTLMHAEGWKRIDFYGFAPGALHQGCTSLYFKSSDFFSSPKPPPECRDRIF